MGCVLTEIFFERTLLGQGRECDLLLARLHRNVDLYVEIPAFAGVFVTGGLLLSGTSFPALLWVKIVCATLAVAANIFCVRLVFRRLEEARAGNWPAFARVDRRQHRVGAVVLLGLVAALVMGVGLSAM